jgi:DNA topoisomerase-1
MTRTAASRPSAAAPAEAVPPGLTWVADTQPGIRRVRHGAGFRYVDASGRPVRDAATLARIRRLAIPPAYESVWICASPDGHLQATGRDARGRKQYRYHAVWQRERGLHKFERLGPFGRALSRIRARVQRDLAGPAPAHPTRTRVIAALVRLLDTTFLRIGNAEYARGNGSYGLTTLRCRHAGIRDAEVRLSFEGKSGVRHEARLDDARVAAVVRRCRELPGQELFQYCDADGAAHKVTSADVNDYLAEAAGTHVTAKDFRTWHGSVLALEFARLGGAGDPRCATPAAVLERVAGQLGNTAAVCRKAYVHPAVLERVLSVRAPGADGEAGAGTARVRRPRARADGDVAHGRRLSAAEHRLLALLAAASTGPAAAGPGHSACLGPAERPPRALHQRTPNARHRAAARPSTPQTAPVRPGEGQAPHGRRAARRARDRR